MMILKIEPGKAPERMKIPGDLKSMKKVVGGDIQAIYPFEEPIALVCHEEGKLIGLPLNRALRDEDGKIYDMIAGTFFLCGAPPEEDHFTIELWCWAYYNIKILCASASFPEITSRYYSITPEKPAILTPGTSTRRFPHK